VLGAEGGTYYATEQALTKEAAATVLECLKADGPRTVAQIVAISDAGRAPKNDPAIFALALAAADDKLETRTAALSALPKVCRIGTHLFHFVRDVEHFRRWGRGLRAAVAKWYTDKPAERLAFDVVKYQQRDGWAHRDVLRLAHPKPPGPQHDAVFRYVVGGVDALGAREVANAKGIEGRGRVYPAIEASVLPRIIEGVEKAKAEKDPKALARLIRDYGLTHEMIPTDLKGSAEVWEALFEDMPTTALVRNLGKMSSLGLFAPMSARAATAMARLTDVAAIRKARLHPIALLSALNVYKQGHGEKGSLKWQVSQQIVDALDSAFYLAFDAIQPSGKRTLIALDISGSMGGPTIAGCPGVTPRVGSAAMAMATMRTEPAFHVVGFSHSLIDLPISPRQRLDDVVRMISGLPFGNTDCSLPMLYAAGNNLDVDTFVVYTDNETWAGHVHPFQALRAYRAKMNKPAAKLIVVGMTATGFTIADPNDPGMLDVVGFDTSAPAVMANFARE
jgi:60 kDa SS-A/Ro ribonucleoprotein